MQVHTLTNEPKIKQTEKIAIAANFTAEPLAESLAFWLEQLNISEKIEFAPYNQVFQQLLAPNSLFSTNSHGINIILLRLEDWQNSPKGERAAIEQTVKEFLLALTAAASQNKNFYLVCLCPNSPKSNELGTKEVYSQIEDLINSELANINNICLISSLEIIANYPVEHYYDPESDRLGHIPFTPQFFAGLSTAIARKIYAIKNPPYKVIVLDCDNTLWKGVCGEDGAMGIEIDPPRQALQEFMVAQYEAGMLICLCSKNSEADVIEVFQRRPEMRLRREHIISWRINWEFKSNNLKSLAQELNLGLDSFIFIDDNPVEGAEVQTNCPEVLTLVLPQNVGEIPRFLQHIWAFDRLQTTTEDQQRTALYRQNLERDRFYQQALTLTDFLTSLKLEIEILPPTASQLSRVAQLTQRTNQFNLTTIRRSEQEIQQLCQSGELECLQVTVSDRFGDYGLVGVILFTTNKQILVVDTFLLSCRVLGRGVEHRMLARLGEIAQQTGQTQVHLSYLPTAKNEPALNFLNQVGLKFKQPSELGYTFQFPVEVAQAVLYCPSSVDSADVSSQQEVENIASSNSASQQESVIEQTKNRLILLRRIATEFYSAAQVFVYLETQKRQRPELQQALIKPHTALEQKLAQIWAQLLKVEEVGIEDNFFELGGNSLLAVQLFAQIDKLFNKTLPLSTLLQAPTIKQLAKVVEQEEVSEADKSLLVAIQPKGSQPALFLPHAAGGEILFYRPLALALGENQPFYAIEPQGLDGKQPPHTSVEEMAAYYIKVMQTFQPQGPYFLGGFCGGGLIAYEMARQLEAQGEEIALLVMLDSINPLLEQRATPPLRYRLYIHWLNFSQLSLADKPKYILSRAKQLLNRIGRKFRQKQPLIAQTSTFREVVATSLEQAFNSYVPQTYLGKILLLRAQERPTSVYNDPKLGWGDLAIGGIEVYDVPGHHYVMMEQAASVQLIAEKIAAAVRKKLIAR